MNSLSHPDQRSHGNIASHIRRHRDQLELLERMWSDQLVQCYDDHDMPDTKDEEHCSSVFLAGPTSTRQILEYNWRCKAVAYLREAGYEGIIYVPEPRGTEVLGDFSKEYIIHWSSERLLSPGYKVFWIPRNNNDLFGTDTKFELGVFTGQALFGTVKPNIFVGWPAHAERMGLPAHYALERAGMKHYVSLRTLCFAVMGIEPPEDFLSSDESQ